MIVKLKTTKIDAPSQSQESWAYFDGFRKIKQIYLTKEYLKTGNLHKEHICDYLVMEKSTDMPTVLLICSLDYNKECLAKNEYTILTNQQVYLLNDEGKTIERIN
uniref:Uncharacterized protein n=1 Tax=viral metagenome TaxID=1070528 RepID=A0A6M3KR67_9ZZZZ